MHLSLPNLHFSSCQNALIILTQLTRTDMIVVDPFVQMLSLSTVWSDKYFLRREAFGMSERLFYCIRMRELFRATFIDKCQKEFHQDVLL